MAVCVLVWRFFFLDADSAKFIQEHFGFWMMVVVLGLWLAQWSKVSREVKWDKVRNYLIENRWALPVVALGALFLQVHEPRQLRVVHDEPMHLATAKLMFEEGRVAAVSRTHFLDGEPVYTGVLPVVRMFLFPTLLAIVHALLGYDVDNIFLINGLLGICLLFLVYEVGRRLTSRRGGVLAVLLLAGLPLLAQNVTSGGYDVLNLVMILGFFLSLQRYMLRPGAEGLDLMLLTGLLLAYSRYESIVYLLLAVLAAAIKWSFEKKIQLTPLAVLSPLAIWPCLTANVIIWSDPAFTLAHMREDGAGFFDVRFWTSNLAEAVYYMFSIDRGSTNSLILSWLGGISLTILLVATAGRIIRSGWTEIRSARVVMVMFSLVALGIYVLVLTNFWGRPTESSATRFILPLMLVMALAVPLALQEFRRPREFTNLALISAFLFILTYSASVSSKARKTREMDAAAAYKWFLAEAEKMGNKGRVLYAAPSSLYLANHGFPSVPTAAIAMSEDKAALSLEAGIYDEILIMDLVSFDPVQRVWRRPPTVVIPAGVELKLVSKSQLTDGFEVRMLRFVPPEQPAEGSEAGAGKSQLRTQFESKLEWKRYRLSILP